MPGVHRLQHVERLGAAHLADDDPIRSHAQRIAHQIPLQDRASSFDVGRPRFHPRDVACCSWSSAESSIVMIRSRASM